MKYLISILPFLYMAIPTYARLSNNAIPEPYTAIGMELRDTCLKKLGLTMDDYEKFDFNGDRNVKCYMSCVFQEANWMDDVGTILHDNVENHKIPGEPDHLDKFRKNCPWQPEGPDACEIAYSAMSCFRPLVSDAEFYFP